MDWPYTCRGKWCHGRKQSRMLHTHIHTKLDNITQPQRTSARAFAAMRAPTSCLRRGCTLPKGACREGKREDRRVTSDTTARGEEEKETDTVP